MTADDLQQAVQLAVVVTNKNIERKKYIKCGIVQARNHYTHSTFPSTRRICWWVNNKTQNLSISEVAGDLQQGFPFWNLPVGSRTSLVKVDCWRHMKAPMFDYTVFFAENNRKHVNVLRRPRGWGESPTESADMVLNDTMVHDVWRWNVCKKTKIWSNESNGVDVFNMFRDVLSRKVPLRIGIIYIIGHWICPITHHPGLNCLATFRLRTGRS